MSERPWIYVGKKAHPDHGGQVEVSLVINPVSKAFVTHARWEKGHWDWGTTAANANRRDDEVYAWRELSQAAPLLVQSAMLGDGTIADEGLVRPIASRTFDRFLRFRFLRSRGNDAFDGEGLGVTGVIATYIEEEVEKQFMKAYPFAISGDLLEIEYPASYGYFLFGKDGAGEWKYTTKSV
jgi:hypothetical protein